MRSTTQRALTRSAAAAAAAALVIAPGAAMASDFPLEPRESDNSVAQSVQIRVNADGTPNGNAVDFRWSVTQITAQGDPNTDITVKVPEQGLLLHNLQQFGTIPQEDGQGIFDISLNDVGFGTARSVSLYPPDKDELPVELKVEFTLDGEPITAEDLVGESGLVTATYTITNTTGQTLTVPITSVTGDEIEKEVEADVPLVVEAATLLPQTFAGLNTGTGLAGADGRGNWQVKWIALPFAPLSADGSAKFGWAAHVENATIPSMLIQVLPIYIPEGSVEGKDPASEEAKEAAKNAVPPPDVSGDVASIKSGVADVIGGLETLTADDGSEDPLTTVEGDLNAFFEEFGTNIETIGELVDPNNPDGATALVTELQAIVTEASATVDEIESSGIIDAIDEASSVLTPANAELLTELADPLNKLADNADLFTQLAATADEIQFLADNAAAIAAAIGPGCFNPPGDGEPLLPPEVCDNKDKIIAALESDELQKAADILNSNQFQQAADIIASEEFQKAANALEQAAPFLVPLADALQVLDTQLPGVITTLGPVLDALDGVLSQLETALVGLSTQLEIIGNGLAEKNVDLPTVDAVLAEITAQILASEGGQQVTSGLAQIDSGVGGAKTDIGNYVAELTVALQAAKAQVDEAVAEGKDAVGAVIDKADTLKAEVAGLVVAAGTSPLPYGGEPAQAPEGTKLAGAYEFRIDPADYEAPSTLPRILIAIVALIGAGLLGNWAYKRRKVGAAAAVAGAEAGSDQVPVTGAEADAQDTSVITPVQALAGAGVGAAGAAAAAGASDASDGADLTDGAGDVADAGADSLTEGVDTVTEAGDDLTEGAGNLADQAQDAAGEAADSVEGAAGAMADQAQHAAGSVEGAASEATDAAGDAAQSAADAVEGAGEDLGENKAW